MRALAPITVGTADFDVALVADGTQAAWTPGSIRAANESPVALQCILGADVHWLQPWSVDVWPVRAVTSMHVHPVPLVSPVPTPQWSTLLVTVAQPFEEFPGSYPATLDRQNSAFYNRQVLGSVTATAGGTNHQSFQLPAGTASIGYAIDFSGGTTPDGVVMQGDQSTDVYRSDFPPLSEPVVHPALLPGLDTSITLTVTAHPAQNARVFLIAFPTPVTESVQLDLLDVVPVTFNGIFGPARAAPWQAATASLPLVGGIAAGGNQTAAPAPGVGLSIWLHTLLFQPGTAGTFGKITQGVAGTSMAEWAYANGNPIPMDFGGVQLPPNTALIITNDSGVNLASEAGMVAYTPA